MDWGVTHDGGGGVGARLLQISSNISTVFTAFSPELFRLLQEARCSPGFLVQFDRREARGAAVGVEGEEERRGESTQPMINPMRGVMIMMMSMLT